uniref:ADP ribosylation factor-like GTPase 9 n=1 Tax=Xenopus tropicalis TaxID=8364 RepID=A0A803KCG0_XENTR
MRTHQWENCCLYKRLPVVGMCLKCNYIEGTLFHLLLVIICVLLYWLYCFVKEPQTRKQQILVLGLDGSGKTSVLNSIVTNRGNHSTVPTEGVHAVCITNGNSKMEFLEVGGSEQLRQFWERYLDRALALIYVVDSSDHSRLPLAKMHLHQLIQHSSSLPLVVLANKQDLENAYHITDIHDALALSEICEKRKLYLIGTHVATDGSELPSSIEDTRELLAQLLLEIH